MMRMSFQNAIWRSSS